MKIEHIAMYVCDLERARDFFMKYLGGKSNSRKEWHFFLRTIIDKVIKSIQAGRYVWIQDMDVTPMYPEPDERGFHVD